MPGHVTASAITIPLTFVEYIHSKHLFETGLVRCFTWTVIARVHRSLESVAQEHRSKLTLSNPFVLKFASLGDLALTGGYVQGRSAL